MPDSTVIFREWKPRLLAFGIEETEIHTFGALGVDREVGPTAGRCRPQGKPIAREHRRPDLVTGHGSIRG
jgi:hypothetical protein